METKPSCKLLLQEGLKPQKFVTKRYGVLHFQRIVSYTNPTISHDHGTIKKIEMY
jgi:hypothetical protein